MTIDPLTTVPAAIRERGLDDAAAQRLYRLLRGRAVTHGHPSTYRVADVEQALRFDQAARRQLPASNDLVYCQACHKAYIDDACLQRHLERDHGGPA